jgi:hypothetical protein
MESSNMEYWKIEPEEKAYYAPVMGLANLTPLQLYIPKIMPLITKGVPKTTKSNLRATCFVNDSACKPVVASSITTQNFKSVPRYDNQVFARSYLKQNALIVLEVCNGNADDMHITTKVDRSTDM